MFIGCGAPRSAFVPIPLRVAKLEAWFDEIVKAPETKAFFNKQGEDPYPGDRNLVASLHAEETKAWREYVRLAKIEPM